jgi:hypothetical protein
VDQKLQVKEVQVDRVPRLEILLAVAVAVQAVLAQMVLPQATAVMADLV